MGESPFKRTTMSKRKTDVMENFGEHLVIEKLDPKAKRQTTQLLVLSSSETKLKQRVNAQGA